MPTPEVDVSLLQLSCFVAVVDAGSLAEAARQLGVSTASVSKAIARLEQASALKLLHRSTHAVSLTQDGTQLLELAREAVSAASAFRRSARTRHQDSAIGWVRVTAPVGFMLEVLSPLLANFSRKHPSIRLDLRASNDLVDLAKDGVDLAVRSGTLARVPGHLQRPWFKFPWVACASPDYIAKEGQPKIPADLDKHTLIGFRNQRTGQVRPWWFRSPDPDHRVVQFAPDATTIFDDGASAWRAVTRGAGIGSAPLWLAADDLRAGRAIEVLRDWRDADETMTVLRRDRRLTPNRVNLVIAHLLAHAPSLDDLA
jgi:DNA-binding transcriptional LysR family regulator